MSVPGFTAQPRDVAVFAAADGVDPGTCNYECGVTCRNQCKNSYDVPTCTAKCMTPCLGECEFEPYCESYTSCQDGIRYIRYRCYEVYNKPPVVSPWVPFDTQCD